MEPGVIPSACNDMIYKMEADETKIVLGHREMPRLAEGTRDWV